MDSLLLLLCTPELRLKNCKIFSMKRRKLAKNWQRVQEVGNIQSDSKSKVNVGDRKFLLKYFVFFKYNTERQTWKEKIIFWELCQGKKKENTFETNYITNPHVNVFYYIISTLKLVIKYLKLFGKFF